MNTIAFSNHESIIRFFTGQRVAFVGPSAILEGTNSGEKIDKYDIICRVNHSICLDEQKKDYGSRCDFLFHGMTSNISLNDDVREKWFERLLLEKPKMIGFVRSAKRKYKGTLHLYSYNYYKEYLGEHPKLNDIFTYHFSNGLQNTFIDAMGMNPLSGTLALIVLLSMPIKELYLTGFDFYQNEKLYHTFINHESLTEQPEFNPYYKPNSNENINEFSYHNQTKHLLLTKYLRDKYKNSFTVDDYIESLFSKLPNDFDYSTLEFQTQIQIDKRH